MPELHMNTHNGHIPWVTIFCRQHKCLHIKMVYLNRAMHNDLLTMSQLCLVLSNMTDLFCEIPYTDEILHTTSRIFQRSVDTTGRTLVFKGLWVKMMFLFNEFLSAYLHCMLKIDSWKLKVQAIRSCYKYITDTIQNNFGVK